MNDQIERLKVLWKSGRDKYNSFFAVFREVRREIGDEALGQWCIDNLQIGISRINNIAAVLNKDDEEATRESLAAATKIEKNRRAAEKEALAKKRAIEKAEYEKQIAEKEAAATKAKIEKQRAEEREQKRQYAKTQRSMRGSQAGFSADRRNFENSDAPNAEKAKEFYKMCEKGEAQWIQGSVGLAKILCEERKLHGANDISFGAWFEETGLPLNKNDRAALVKLGDFKTQRLREIFESTKSRSYQTIWEQIKPNLRVVES